jgi:hypothetical protein
MFTNSTDECYLQRCELAGANFLLDKSKQFDEIPGLLRTLMQAKVENPYG